MPEGQTKSKSMLLTLIAVIVFFSGFIGVYLVNAAWERQVPETILISDSSAVPYEQKMGSIVRNQALKNYTSSYSYKSHYDAAFNTTELTPVYSGNNTWVYSLGTLKPYPTGDLDAVSGTTAMFFMFRLPNIDTYLIDSVYCKINLTATIGIAGSYVVVGGFDPAKTLPVYSDPDDTYVKDIEYTVPTADNSIADYTFDIDVPLVDSIDIYQNVNDGKGDGWIYFELIQVGHSGWDPAAVEITFQINGTYIDETNKMNAVAWSIGGAAFLCTLTMIFMTDSIDVKDILKKLKGA